MGKLLNESPTRKGTFLGDTITDVDLKSSKHAGFKANHFDCESGEEYWISGCKRRGEDRLYPGTIDIDEDVREQYWTEIRGSPKSLISILSEARGNTGVGDQMKGAGNHPLCIAVIECLPSKPFISQFPASTDSRGVLSANAYHHQFWHFSESECNLCPLMKLSD